MRDISHILSPTGIVDPLHEDLFVVTVISNPVRYKRRYELYHRFKAMCDSANVHLVTVEQAFGDRPHVISDPNDPFHLQIRSCEELWHKENMINLGIAHGRRLLPRAKCVAWIDADCAPTMNPRAWFEETWHQLQHYQFVQMWENMLDLDHYHNPFGPPQPSFMANYVKFGTPNPEEMKEIERKHRKPYDNNFKIFGRPGLAWAANIDALDKVGGVIDYCILGAGDWYMAYGLIGCMSNTFGGEISSSSAYLQKLLHWEKLAARWIKKDVGYVKGLVYHYFHGRKVNRGYGTRGKILVDAQYNPDTDIKKDMFGQYQLETWEDRQIKLRDQIRGYFRARDEDCIYNGR